MQKEEEKKQETKKIQLSDLPASLRDKYKNHELFKNQKVKKQRVITPDTQEQLQELKVKRQPIEERLAKEEISPAEQKVLQNVFKELCVKYFSNQQVKKLKVKSNSKDNEQDKNKDKESKPYFDADDLGIILQRMGLKLTKQEIKLMLWEVDENLDCLIDEQEFINMYKRCIMKNSDLEPKSLYHMVQFLMYCKSDNRADSDNDENKYKITVEDTLELLYVRFGREQLDQEIKAIFGEDEGKTFDGQEKRITFQEYLEKINKRAMDLRQKQIQEKKQKYKSPPNMTASQMSTNFINSKFK